MKSQQIRNSFLKYFKSRGLPVLPSSSLVPQGDPTLLFTAAGMVQFKANFLGLDKSLKGATTCQKCLRTTDIDNVGFTSRHLTFFEMLGNFSFGDYFKKEAIAWAWDYLTKELGLDARRLYVSIYKGGIAPRDAEAYNIWAKIISKDRIFELGEKDNFWTMGPTGPCGPCSEIYYDFTPTAACPECQTKGIACDCGRFVEIWNLVFTQFNRLEDGSLEPLPQKNIDTGMGLERLCMAVQDVKNPFDTDLFVPIQEHAKKILLVEGKTALETSALRIVADHIRAAVFLLSEGLLPSNEGRGYILRRLIRRAARYGKLIGRETPFLNELVPTVIGVFHEIYPELITNSAHIILALRNEETAFFKTLADGEQRLQNLIKNSPSKISGQEAFYLYETYGFPFELTKEILAEKGIAVDEESFYAAQEKAKISSKVEVDKFEKEKATALQALAGKGLASTFTGYQNLTEEAKVIALLNKEYQPVDFLDQDGYALFDKTPFYAESGGQIGDIGTVEKDNETIARVLDTQKPLGQLILHKVAISKGKISLGNTLTLKVDEIARFRTSSNHTAVHIINAALKKILGDSVRQAGSYVSPEKLRFDYTTPQAPTTAQLGAIWGAANDIIARNLKVEAQVRPLSDAKELKATLLVGEKYVDPARFLIIGGEGFKNPLDRVSLELCGGTHVKSTGEVMALRLIKDSAVSAGVRRIEAIAGLSAVDYLKEHANTSLVLGKLLNVKPEDLIKKTETLLKAEKDLKKEIADLRRQLLSGNCASPAREEIALKDGGTLLAFNAENTEIKELRNLADGFAAKNSGKIILVSTDKDGRKSFVVKSFAGGPDAGKLCKTIAGLVNGSGGGRAEFAQGGGVALPWQEFCAKIKAALS
ncbi:MAG: alanine--tRNA ligase [Elusimicrobiota bacterium]|jgi:alanyl-tRNA synthetase|nr:alanine--tRNA ligase [Elusimicrobiota bacterium]